MGGIVAVCTMKLRRLPASAAAALSWLGLASVLAAGFLFTSRTPYPGGAVALPVFGAALIIAGGAAEPRHGVESLLRLRPFQWVGLISYSLYLWHWPVLTIAAQRSGTVTLSATDSLFWVLVSLGLAAVTYHLVENPIRHWTTLVAKRRASLALGGCLIVTSLAVTTAEIHLHQGEASAVSNLGALKTSDPCPPPTERELTPLLGTGPRTSRRVVSRLLVVGDSTACTMLPGLEAVGIPLGVQVVDGAVIGCGVVSGRLAPQFVNGKDVNSGSSPCQSRAVAAEHRALRLGRPNVVVWASSWEREGLAVQSDGHLKGVTPGSAQWYAVLLQRMKQRVQQFTATGATVVMLTQPPFVDFGKPRGPTPEDEDFERLNGLLATVARDTPHVMLVDLASFVCPPGPPCPAVVDNVFARGDGAHYTAVGSLLVARWLMPRLHLETSGKPVNPLPVVKVAIPSNGVIVKSKQLLDATTAYNIGVSKVEFEVTGGPLANVTIGVPVSTKYGWVVLWNTAGVPDGTYTLRAVAYDAAGDRSTSAGMTVRVAN